MSNLAGPSRPSGSTATLISLEPSVIDRLTPARLFKDAVELRDQWHSTAHEGYSIKPQISSIDFDDSGGMCVTAGEDEAFVTWDVVKGVRRKLYPSRKYGIGQIRFTHKSTNVIHTSTKGDNDIRYHSTHDNRYLTYFKGHTARVRSIQMHPTKDAFMSAGDDGTVRMWDLRNQQCQALMNNIGGSTIAAYDPDGTVFAVACSELAAVMLYATESADAPPFHFARLVDPELAKASQPPRQPIFTSISFSKKGDLILVGTSSDAHYVLDAFDLSIHRRLVGHQGLETDHKGHRDPQPRRGGSGEEVGWTSDSRWIYSGSSDGGLCFWDMLKHPKVPDEEKSSTPPAPETLQPTIKKKPEPSHELGPSRAIKFNPRHAMMAVGGERLAFLLPQQEENIENGY